MSTLLEIYPISTNVAVGSGTVKTYGWSASNIAELLINFPDEVRDLAKDVMAKFKAKMSIGEILQSIDPAVLDALSFQVIPTAIVFALKVPKADVIASEAVARDLPITTQLLLLKAAFNNTFPEGLSDFLKALGLGGSAEAESEISSNTGSAE